MASVKVLLFGDGTVDPVDCIKELASDARTSPTLDAFLRMTAASLRDELALSTSPAKQRYPKFDSVDGLADWYATLGAPEVAVFPVLLCAAQLGVLIRSCEKDPTLFDLTDREPTYCIGLCNGMIAAAAAATCRSLADLLAVGPSLVCLNMRLMLATIERSTAIDPSRETWTVVTPGLTPQEHANFIDEYVRQKGSMPLARQPYISCESDAVTTISGPPSTLEDYFQSCETLRTAKRVNTPINGAYHASHLWHLDLQNLLGDASRWRRFHMRSKTTFLSINTGEPFETITLDQLLLSCMEEIASKTFRWGTVLRALCHDVKQTYESATLLPVGPDRVTPAVAKALSDAGVKATITRFISSGSGDVLPQADDIAIVGLAARLPGADDLEQLWDQLCSGRDMCGTVPLHRSAVNDPSKFGYFIGEPGLFDAKLFGMSPREARQTDPGQRLSLLTTYEALEMAGYAPNSRPSFHSDRIAAFWGQTLDDYRDTEAAQNVDIYFVTGGTRAFGPGRMNYHFKWEGASISVDTACSSSAVAVQLAFQALRSGECDMAVAGGSNIITSPSMYNGLAKGGFLSKTGRCKTFSEEADGYGRGEGVGTVVLKRLSDALADHDNICAVIKSCSTNHSAFADSITRPHSDAQIKVMHQTLRQACLRPSDIDAVEMHGTGTQVGDRTEFSSVAAVLRPGKDKRRQKVPVGSIKANVGHGEGAAGISSLVKVVLMLRNDSLPPNIGVRTGLNRKFQPADLDILSIDQISHPFQRPEGGRRRVLLNSFQAAGGNTAMIVEDAPAAPQRPEDARKYHVVAVSGHTHKSFSDNQQKLLAYAESNPRTRISDLAYTTTARRMHQPFKKAFVTESFQQLAAALRNNSTFEPRTERLVIFAFTGQGSHSLATASQLMQSCSVFRKKLEHCEKVCRNLGLPGFMEHMQDPSCSADNQIVAAQISLVAVQIALTAAWRAWGLAPAAVIGHSIGEYAALVAAGVLDEADALFLAGTRAQSIQETCRPGEYCMLSVAAPVDKVETLLLELDIKDCVVACDNAPSSVVVSGPISDIQHFAQELSNSKISNTKLELDFGFHSPQMKEIGLRLRSLGKAVHFHKPQVPVASTLLRKTVRQSGVFDADYMASQTMYKVCYREALASLSSDLDKQAIDNAIWLEVGTHPTCGSMIVSNMQVPTNQVLYSLRRNEAPYQSISKSIARAWELGVNVNWAAYHHEHHTALSVLELPRYAFDLTDHWIPYEHRQSKQEPDEPQAPTRDPSLSPFHYKAKEHVSEGNIEIEFVCELSDDKLIKAIKGHMIEGSALCPASVYADLALHAAARILTQSDQQSWTPQSLDVGKVSIVSPLTLSNDEPSTQKILVNAGWKASAPQDVQIAFSSTLSEREVGVHCECTVSSGDTKEWSESWQELQYLINSRVDYLTTQQASRPIHTLYKQMVYTIFASAVVDYSEAYRAISRLAVDYDNKEAIADIHIPSGSAATSKESFPGPYCLDALMHMAGFILNSDPHVPVNTVFIANGWASLKLCEPLLEGQAYVCHARMQVDRQRSNVYVGNVTVMKAGYIIGVCRGLRFHQMTRKSLQRLLSSSSSSSAGDTQSRYPSSSTTIKSTPKPKVVDTSARQSRRANLNPSQMFDPQKLTSSTVVLELIATETNSAVEDLRDDARLVDLGIDSLLSISLLDQFKKKCNIELPANTFSCCETVGALQEFIQIQMSSMGRPQTLPSDEQEGQSSSEHRPRLDLSCPATKPAVNSSVSLSVNPRALRSISSSASKAEILCEIIASEVGMSPDEITGEKMIADLGIDSLLTLSIVQSYKSRTGDDLAPTIFYEYPSISSVVSALTTDVDTNDSSSHPTSESGDTDITTPPPPPSSSEDASQYSCVSMRLQGEKAEGGPTLFFLPDGSGSLFSYIHLPEIQPGLSVYALDSPFHKNPREYNLSFATVASIYKNEIRNIQPHGPYIIAGWSLGGVHAYEVARQLLEEGETVRHLFMLDSPCPGTLPPLPHASLDLLEKAGIFQGLNKSVGSVADHTRVHFVAVTNAFQHWDHRALTADELDRLGKVTILWAGHGVLEDDDDDDDDDDDEAANAVIPSSIDHQVEKDMTKAKKWLCGKRSNFGPQGWDELIGKDSIIDCQVMPGNHFSMMFPPVVPEVAKAIGEALLGRRGR